MIVKTVLLIIVSEMLAATGQVLFKKSTNALRTYELHRLEGHARFIRDVLSAPKIWMGFSAMTASLIVWLIALAGADLSLVFSLGSLQYIIILIASHIFLDERIDRKKLVGTLVIIIGIVCIALS